MRGPRLGDEVKRGIKSASLYLHADYCQSRSILIRIFGVLIESSFARHLASTASSLPFPAIVQNIKVGGREYISWLSLRSEASKKKEVIIQGWSNKKGKRGVVK